VKKPLQPPYEGLYERFERISDVVFNGATVQSKNFKISFKMIQADFSTTDYALPEEELETGKVSYQEEGLENVTRHC